jgi:hypothetical protein
VNTGSHHEVESVDFVENELVLTVDGNTYRFEVSAISERLAKATQAEREVYRISPSGYGIHWPLLDEDLSIDGLLGIKHAPSSVGAEAAR